ncbi:ABC transporter permease [Catonella massiliensis]|uniref:FtsX-like permease family protein n=1 Tax=Catonella massiliensis TaxID=2799636 RepID=A0ABS1IXD1_9FIRM|nr:FtsX-like permease family protein [Catonella massiliensis]MBF1007221.1 FtsX-like permease family protein [Lachnospiraceae bacterium]MBF1013939.1 FtsX-like permease family protein [Lachnospiraceae bacterium]MBK5896557.1 FtsX-like permease family protein [Catonella massiliensis]
MKNRKMFLRMITASLMRRKSRMIIALLAIAIGAAILSGLVTIYYDVPRQMGAEFRNYGANMVLTPTDRRFTQSDLKKATDVIKSNELVGATPFRYETVRMHEQPILAAGTIMDDVKKTSPYWLVDGNWPKQSGELLLGKNISDSLELKVGDSVTVSFTPENVAKDQQDNTLDFKVTGILNTGGREEDYVYMSMEDLETLAGAKGNIDLAEVSISTSGEGLNKYVAEINKKVDTVSASLVKRVTASETTVLSKLQALVFLVTAIVLALTMICVATTMTAVVTERRKEIGLRKAIGASDSSIIKEFMGEGILLGGLGGVVGSVIGFAFAQTVSVNVFGSSISFRPLLVPITIIVSIAVTGIACLIPIRTTTKIDPALVLKGE